LVDATSSQNSSQMEFTETVNEQIDLHCQDLTLIQEEELFLMEMQLSNGVNLLKLDLVSSMKVLKVPKLCL
jgi:hypothetical protein